MESQEVSFLWDITIRTTCVAVQPVLSTLEENNIGEVRLGNKNRVSEYVTEEWLHKSDGDSTKYQFPWPFRKLVLFETFKFIEYAANYQVPTVKQNWPKESQIGYLEVLQIEMICIAVRAELSGGSGT